MQEKQYYTYNDFEEAVDACSAIIDLQPKTHLIGIARGSFTLLHRLSCIHELPYTILKYSTYDRDDSNVEFGMQSDPISVDDVLFIIDDIADTGNTIKRTIEYLHEKYPNNKIEVFTIYGSSKKFPDWNYQIEHNGEWVVFPWEQ